MKNSESNDAFTILLKELNTSLDTTNQDGARAFQTGNLDTASVLVQRAQKLEDLRERVRLLANEWDDLVLKRVAETKKTSIPKGGSSKKLKRGLRTHEDEYRIPLLQALVDLGGSSDLHSVIDRVGEIMKPILNEYDYTPINSDPDTPRWRNSTQWVRFSLVKEGFMSSDSPAGTWEITEAGRQWLAENEELT